MIVGPHPLRGEFLELSGAFEFGRREPFVPDGSAESLDVGVLFPLSRLKVFDLDRPLVGPVLQVTVSGISIVPGCELSWQNAYIRLGWGASTG